MTMLPGIVGVLGSKPPLAGTWDPAHLFGNTLSNGNRTVLTASSANPCVGLRYNSSGKRYFEIRMDAYSGTQTTAGIYPSLPSSGQWPGTGSGAFGIIEATGTGNDQAYYNGSFFSNIPDAFSWRTNGSIIAFAIDLTAGKLWFAVNNTWLASGNPAAGTSPIISVLSGPFTPGFTGATNTQVTLRCITADFTYTPPTGFSAWAP